MTNKIYGPESARECMRRAQLALNAGFIAETKEWIEAALDKMPRTEEPTSNSEAGR